MTDLLTKNPHKPIQRQVQESRDITFPAKTAIALGVLVYMQYWAIGLVLPHKNQHKHSNMVTYLLALLIILLVKRPNDKSKDNVVLARSQPGLW